jgi:hypothetical protein
VEAGVRRPGYPRHRECGESVWSESSYGTR